MNTIAYTQRLSMVLPPELTQLKQFILWRAEPDKDGKPRKVPYQCTGFKASVTEPKHWSSFSYALECMRKPDWATGIGFVFTADDPYCGIDLDNIWGSDADEGADWALEILENFKDTYGEASPSDTGYKIWCKAKPQRCGKWSIGGGAVEIYDHGRFFTLTGSSNRVQVITDHQSHIDKLIEDLTPDVEPGVPNYKVFASEITPGERYPALRSVCGTLRRRGICSEAILACLLEMNRVQCQAKHDPARIQRLVKDSESWNQSALTNLK